MCPSSPQWTVALVVTARPLLELGVRLWVLGRKAPQHPAPSLSALPAGIPIRSTMDNPTTTQYAGLMHNFILKARSTVREIDPQNDLTFLRIRSKKNEIMVAPDKDYFLIVIQNPTE
ncbi:dynein light chain roadblock-type 1 [Rhinolophus ferrumequinum]|uniref:Dynein light chain roadblock-type 1 n=1 Tax=Rhinolophus ferrumequinum TaxID=59479 RepID=A0A7J7S7C4_RHIFE|nr:dynein light chain roadblock-type 1 [Rhinolophus ferrumequinum]